jgi:hypothetical protein
MQGQLRSRASPRRSVRSADHPTDDRGALRSCARHDVRAAASGQRHRPLGPLGARSCTAARPPGKREKGGLAAARGAWWAVPSRQGDHSQAPTLDRPSHVAPDRSRPHPGAAPSNEPCPVLVGTPPRPRLPTRSHAGSSPSHVHVIVHRPVPRTSPPAGRSGTTRSADPNRMLPPRGRRDAGGVGHSMGTRTPADGITHALSAPAACLRVAIRGLP